MIVGSSDRDALRNNSADRKITGPDLTGRGMVGQARQVLATAPAAMPFTDAQSRGGSRMLAPSENVVVAFNRHTPRRPAAPLHIDPLKTPPDPVLLARYPAQQCLREAILPWRRVQGQTVILAESAPSPELLAALGAAFGPFRIASCAAGAVSASLRATMGPELARAAETLCPAAQSCRNFPLLWVRRIGLATLTFAALFSLLSPGLLVSLLVLWACITLFFNTALKIAAALLAIRPIARAPAPIPVQWPTISLLVPLYHERDIASHLLQRLTRLDYPRDRLDVLLILEDDDALTARTLAGLDLPDWIRVVAVPQGTLRTKPRALNYALGLARGDILGIYDAEDAPAPDQLRKVVGHFAGARADVACVQGVLDYYNTTSNWLSRCFTLEYASWFRIVLPGLARLGLVVPLGGTTLFLRRAAIDVVGGWDAHNVTEDADLGLRLARAGFRTELLDSVTHEEANARLWPWVRQRTRWLKGYAMTWAVHMAHPVQLWRDIGAWRFFGVQVLFLGTLSQFLLAPLLWSFWLILLGLPHPLRDFLPHGALLGISALFIVTELATLAVAALAARRAGQPWLGLWAPALQIYFPLATIAAWRAITEICARPFYWDKTVHGIFAPTCAPRPAAAAQDHSPT